MKNIKSIEQFLFESKTTAKKRFLDRGLISEEVFNTFLEVDTTPTKKFIEKMCEFFVGGSSEGEIVETFEKATKSNVKFDISIIKTLSELQEILSQEGLTGSRGRVQIGANEKGVEITYEDDRFTVLYITSMSASKKYGSGTTWCISAKEDNQWGNYKNNLSDFYFIYDYKTTNKAWKKIAVEIKGWGIDNIEVYNTFDNAKDYDGWENDTVNIDYLSKNNIPKHAFKYHKDKIKNYKIDYLDINDFASSVCSGDWKINENGEIDVLGSVDMSSGEFTEIPFKFGKVLGGFNCSNNNLTTLKNAPTQVGLYFNCSNNNLTTLKNCPDLVLKYDFNCSNNNLTSIDFFPKKIGRNFICTKQKNGIILEQPIDFKKMCDIGGYFVKQ